MLNLKGRDNALLAKGPIPSAAVFPIEFIRDKIVPYARDSVTLVRGPTLGREGFLAYERQRGPKIFR